MLVLPNVDDIIAIHDQILRDTRGKEGVLNEGLLQAAIDRPSTYQSYVDKFDLHTAAALIADSIARSHAFADGNKRTALAMMTAVYELNGFEFEDWDQLNKEGEAIILWIVKSKPSIPEIEARLSRMIPISLE
jgi:death on curing protein